MNKNMFMKNWKLIFIAGSLALAVFGVAATLHADEQDKPYKATTAEECIQEKQCLKSAFHDGAFAEVEILHLKEDLNKSLEKINDQYSEQSVKSRFLKDARAELIRQLNLVNAISPPQSVTKEKVLKKWENDILIYYSDAGFEKSKYTKFLEKISNVTGINMNFTDSEEAANIFIRFYGPIKEIEDKRYCIGLECGRDVYDASTAYKPKFFYTFPLFGETPALSEKGMEIFSKSTFFTRNKNYHVLGFNFANDKHEIKATECFIFSEHTKLLKDALFKECVTRALGLVNIVTQDHLSLLSGKESSQEVQDYQDLSSLDLHLLKILYSENVKSGMTFNELKSILEK